MARGGARSDKAIVFWGYKGDAHPVAPASANKLDDNGLLLNAATGLIHVYAKNPKIGGQVIARPNYSIAPIGGANFAPADGKAYTLNCTRSPVRLSDISIRGICIRMARGSIMMSMLAVRPMTRRTIIPLL